jgi:hypothetical protein
VTFTFRKRLVFWYLASYYRLDVEGSFKVSVIVIVFMIILAAVISLALLQLLENQVDNGFDSGHLLRLVDLHFLFRAVVFLSDSKLFDSIRVVVFVDLGPRFYDFLTWIGNYSGPGLVICQLTWIGKDSVHGLLICLLTWLGNLNKLGLMILLWADRLNLHPGVDFTHSI